MKIFFVGIIYLLSLNLYAETISTPGAIASISKLPDTQFQYQAAADLSILSKAQTTQFIVSVIPALASDFSLQQILTAFDAQPYIPEIRKTTIAGFPAAEVHAQLQTSNWWLVVQLKELNLFVRVEDIKDARTHRASVEELVSSVRFATASLPPLVSGSYTMSSSYSSSYGSGPSTFSESSIWLGANGQFSTSSYAGVSGADVSGYSQGEGPGGWWQVRGNRILAYEPPGSFYNYRFDAFSNGLELYDAANEKLLWVRK